MNNGVFSRDDKWYFHTKTLEDLGPFDTPSEACIMLEEYNYWLDTGRVKVIDELVSKFGELQVVLKYGYIDNKEEIIKASRSLLAILK